MPQTEMLNNLSWNTTFAGAVVLITILWLFLRKKHHGPWGLPYFGILHTIQNDAYLRLEEMARKKYGDVFLFKVTGKLYVHLASHEAIREVHLKKVECFPYRIQNSLIFGLVLGKGLILEKTEKWKICRKFIAQVLRELTGKEVLGSSFDFAVNNVLEKLRETKGAPVNFMELFQDQFVETVRGIVIGDSNKHLVRDVLNPYIRCVDKMSIVTFFPAGSLAKWYALRFTSFKEMSACRKEMESMLARVVHQRESAVSSGDVENTLIDRYLQERKSRLEKKDPQAEYFDTKFLIETLVQLFGDLCTTVTPLISALLGDLSSKFDVQDRMREEMIRELGEDLNRIPSIDDKIRLPYVNAVLKELMRRTSFFPIFPSLECVTETTICGVRVPVGCVAVVNSWAANHDPKIYDEPDKFKPERFLSSNPRKIEQPTLFGMGRRSCMGEAITTMCLFLFISAVIRNFVIKSEEDVSGQLYLTESIKMKLCATPVDSTKRKESLK